MTKAIFIYPPSQGGLAKHVVLTGQTVLEKTMFKNNVHIHVYYPAARADTPLGHLFPNHIYSVKFDTCCNFFPLHDFIKSVSHPNTYGTKFDRAVK